MAKLNTTVVVGGVMYGPGDVDSKVAARISNPKVWEGKAPSNAGSAVKPLQSLTLTVNNPAAAPAEAPAADDKADDKADDGTADTGTAGQAPDDSTAGDGVEIPPKGGAGSGEPAWRAYAEAKGVDVSEVKTRDEIVAALDAAGVPTE